MLKLATPTNATPTQITLNITGQKQRGVCCACCSSRAVVRVGVIASCASKRGCWEELVVCVQKNSKQKEEHDIRHTHFFLSALEM
mmetsp:Transcript_38040/g.75224  ORF Transcript_38040/g.75224 Transcript_38040/m.75224 type:complete len:85 (+) Transcript_38040:45-299(+)